MILNTKSSKINKDDDKLNNNNNDIQAYDQQKPKNVYIHSLINREKR